MQENLNELTLNESRRVLIISNGPIPSGSNSIVEGGGLRCWSIYNGLLQNEIEASIAVPAEYYEPASRLISYDGVAQLKQLCNDFDIVIYNYASGQRAVELFRELPESILRIADLYVPIHVEVSARNVSINQIDTEERNFEIDSRNWESVLQYSDAFLVANRNQELYYLGLLAGIGLLTPKTYASLKFIYTPQGPVHLNQIGKKSRKRNKKILWWGGFYPWFDSLKLKQLADALWVRDSSIKILVVGAINPFVSNKNFIYQAHNVISELETCPNIEFQDWIPYACREDLFLETDLLINFNKIGLENKLSSRTRMMDVIQFGVPLITNGGDPVGEDLINFGAALRSPESIDSMGDLITEILNSSKLHNLETKMEEYSSKRSPSRDIFELAEFIKNIDHSKKESIRHQFSMSAKKRIPKSSESKFLSKKWDSRFTRFNHHLEIYGKKATLFKIFQKFQAKIQYLKFRLRPDLGNHFGNSLKNKKGKKEEKKIFFIFHQLDKSGAPYIGVQLAQLAREYFGDVNVLTASPVDPDMKNELKKSKISVSVLDPRQSVESLISNSIVIVNSSAVPHDWLSEVLRLADIDVLKFACMFIHENEPEIFLTFEEMLKIKALTKRELRILVPSTGTQTRLSDLEGINFPSTVEVLNVSPVENFAIKNKVDKIIIGHVGPTNDFRKRQLDIIFGFALFQSEQKENSENFREVELRLVGIGDDTIGSEVKSLASRLLKPNSYKIIPRISKAELLQDMSEWNAVVSLAENESFGLYMAEAMSGGSIVLRTDISGFDEMVRIGINGFAIESSPVSLSERLQMMSDRTQFPDSQFIEMMENSTIIASKFVKSNFPAFRSLIQELL